MAPAACSHCQKKGNSCCYRPGQAVTPDPTLLPRPPLPSPDITCGTVHETLWSRIIAQQQQQQAGEGCYAAALQGSSSNLYSFQDVFQDVGFDPDNFLFGMQTCPGW